MSRIFGDRDKLRNLDRTVRTLENAAKDFATTLTGGTPAIGKNCPVCDAANPAVERVCRECRHVFD